MLPPTSSPNKSYESIPACIPTLYTSCCIIGLGDIEDIPTGSSHNSAAIFYFPFRVKEIGLEI
jgi:hypothetical protein